jgi:hypothetical protein
VFYGLLSPTGTDSYSRALAVATKKRIPFLLTDAIMIVAYFHPGVKRNMVSKRIKDQVFCHVRSTMKAITSDAILAEWSRFRIEPPKFIEPGVLVTIEAYLTYWAKTPYETLAAAVTRVAECNPTEAECERTFSSIKFAFPRLRGCALEDLVESTCIGASAVAFLRDIEFGDEPSQRSTPINVDAPTVPDTHGISGDQAMKLLELIDSQLEGAANEVDERRRTRLRLESNLCGICNKPDTGHSDNACWVKCTTCAQWYAFECVGIDEDDQHLAEQQDTWTCTDCKTFNA